MTFKPMKIEEMKTELAALATARERAIAYFETEAGPPVAMPDYKAIINDKSNAIECVASKDYVLIQHKEAFGVILYALETAAKDRPLRAKFEEQGGRAWMTIAFSDVKANDSGAGIELGIKAVNSYNKTAALQYSGSTRENQAGHFEFFGLRLDDMSEMSLDIPLSELEYKVDETKMEEFRSYIRHYGKNTHLNVDKLNVMILAMPAVAKRLEEKILAANKMAMNEESADFFLQKIGFGPRTRFKILENFKLNAQTRWGLYQAVSTYASHGHGVSALSEERMLDKAKKLL